VYTHQQFRFDCANLLDEIELAYQELCDALDIPFDVINKQLMRTALAYILEDAINQLTASKFREHVTLTKNLISNYLEFTVKLNNFDMEDIEDIFVQPMIAEALAMFGKLTTRFDRYYSKWEIEECKDFPTMIVNYLGDFRIEEWHKIQDVPSRAPVAVKRHRIRYDDISSAIREGLHDIKDLAISDITLLTSKIIYYYAGKQLDELYKDIVLHLKAVNGLRPKAQSLLSLKQAKSILKIIEAKPSFKRFMEDVKVGETVFHSQTTSRIIFDVIMPNKNLDRTACRKEILDEIDAKGYVTGDIQGKVEIIYG
jgi:hypothetical protein